MDAEKRCQHYEQYNAAGRGLPTSRCPEKTTYKVGCETLRYYCDDHSLNMVDRRPVHPVVIAQHEYDELIAANELLSKMLADQGGMLATDDECYPELVKAAGFEMEEELEEVQQ